MKSFNPAAKRIENEIIILLDLTFLWQCHLGVTGKIEKLEAYYSVADRIKKIKK